MMHDGLSAGGECDQARRTVQTEVVYATSIWTVRRT